MNDRRTILNLLNKFSNDHKNISWKMNCTYCDGLGTTINEIRIMSKPDDRGIGVVTYRVETGRVLLCMFKKLRKTKSENIVDMILDMINYSKGKVIA